MYDIGIIGGGTAGMNSGDLWSESGKKEQLL